jgi:antitoxin MazE
MAIRTNIRKIGGSKGIILPTEVLREIGAEDSLMLSVEQGRIILEAPRDLRQGWFVAAKPIKASRTESKWDRSALSDDSDWVWD